MNKIKSLIFAMFFMLLIFTLNVKAETCTYQDKAELLDEASKVTSNYKLEDIKSKEIFMDPDTGEESIEYGITQKFVVSIYNITKNIYIKITNDQTKEEKYIGYSDTIDGTYTYETDNLEDIIIYTYQVYSNKEACSDEVLKTLVFKKPKQNPNAQYAVCEGMEDHPSCQKFVTEEVVFNPEELQKDKVEKGNEKTTKAIKEEGKSTANFFKDNYIYIIIIIVIIIAVTTITIFIKRKRSTL